MPLLTACLRYKERLSKSTAFYFLFLVLIAAIYYASAKFSLSLAFLKTNISPVWPPTGIAFAAVFLFGYRVLPGIAVGAFLANFYTGLTLPVSGALGIGNALEAFTGVYLVRRFCSSPYILDRIRDVILFFILAGLGSTLVSATIGTTAIYYGGFASGARYSYLWWTWWLGDTCGNLIIAPFLLAWLQPPEHEPQGIGKLLAFLTLVIALGWAIFTSVFPMGQGLAFVTIPLIVIAGYRFGSRGASASCLLFSIIAIYGTRSSLGPFYSGTLNESLIRLQMFIGVISATALLLAAVVNERTSAQEVIHRQLKEKELLLREVHHRVKNNLQVMSSLLGLEAKTLAPEAQKALLINQERLRAMSLVHEKLILERDVARVDLANYLADLSSMILKSYSTKENPVELKLECVETPIPVDQAILCGLIVHEALLNAIQHAFPAGQQQKRIVLRSSSENAHVLIEIADNGAGINPLIDLEKPAHLGLRLITLLTNQLKGSIKILPSPGAGTVLRIDFPFL